MEVIAPRIPYSYIEPRTTLTWREVAYGLENELLAKDGPVELAVVHVGLLKNPPPDILDLAWGPNEFDVRDIVKTLANRENEESEENIQRKWLYLVLAWFYDHRDSLDDPLEQVEMTYSDFGYPKRIAGLIRYMPTKEPSLGSVTANTRRLFEKWASYVDEEGRFFAHKLGWWELLRAIATSARITLGDLTELMAGVDGTSREIRCGQRSDKHT